MELLVIQGPNLNLLGKREEDIYGRKSLDEIHREMSVVAGDIGVELYFFQSNHEGAIIEEIHKVPAAGISGIIINAGAFTHTSIAIRDALAGIKIPFVEVHISNVYSREEFRHHSFLSPLASGIVVGFGINGYLLALRGLVDIMKKAE